MCGAWSVCLPQINMDTAATMWQHTHCHLVWKLEDKRRKKTGCGRGQTRVRRGQTGRDERNRRRCIFPGVPIYGLFCLSRAPRAASSTTWLLSDSWSLSRHFFGLGFLSRKNCTKVLSHHRNLDWCKGGKM